MIRLYSLCRIYLAAAPIYYLWFIAYFFLTDKFFGGINHLAFYSVYWFLAVILYFYFRYIYLITYRRFVLACGWSFVNILLLDWMLQGGFIYYFFVASFVLMPFSFYQVYRISEKMKRNINGIDENGEEFEMDEEEYLKLMKEEEEKERARNEEIREKI